MLCDMSPHFSHGFTDSDIVIKKLAMSSSVPFGERGKLLRNGVEEADDDSYRCGLHVIAELVDGSWIGYTVMAIKLHLLPNSEKDGGKHEDRGPVLKSIAAVDTGVK